MNDSILDDKLKRLFSSQWPMVPPEELIGICDSFADTVLTIFEFFCKERYHIAIGYYAIDLKADIGYLNLYPSRKTIFFNLYLTEFITDYLVYLRYRNQNAFFYFFAKQMRNIELKKGNKDAATLYNRLYSNAKAHIAYNSVEYLQKSIVISLFVALHEMAHHSADFINLVKTELNDYCEIQKLPSYTSEEKTEIACDFIALYGIDAWKLNERFKISLEELTGVSANMMLLINVYKLFMDLTLEDIKNNNQSFQKRLAEITKTVNMRVYGLYMLIAGHCKQGICFKKLNFKETLNTSRVAVELLYRTSEYLNDLKSVIEEYKSLSHEEKEKYRMSESTDVWFYYL